MRPAGGEEEMLKYKAIAFDIDGFDKEMDQMMQDMFSQYDRHKDMGAFNIKSGDNLNSKSETVQG